MRHMFEIYESRMFKAAPGGYIYQPPPLTRFHRPVAYVVDEKQKAAILAVLRARVWLSPGRVLVFALLFGAAIGSAASLFHAPLWVGAALAIEGWIIAAMVGFGLGMRMKLSQLKPILANLPRSNEQLFPDLTRARRSPVPPSPR